MKWFLSALLGIGVCASAAPAAPAPALDLAVQVPEDSAFAIALQEGRFARWVVRQGGARLHVGPLADGDLVIAAEPLSRCGEWSARLEGLPVGAKDGKLQLATDVYGADQALAVRLPGNAKPHWLICGREPSAVAAAADAILMAASEVSWRRLREPFDYLVWEHPWAVRAGRWQTTEAGVTIGPDERNDFAVRATVYGNLAELRRPHVRLRLPSSMIADQDMVELADWLDKAVVGMAAKIPYRLEQPIEVMVEADHVAQARHVGEIGAAVVDTAGSGVADGGERLHLVFHAEDLKLYEAELARLLVRKAGIELPPWFEDGAALWLAESWYGREPWAWMADFAAAGVLPSAAELSSGRRQGGHSGIIWPATAAAVWQRLPGKDLRGKLAHQRTEAQVAAVLTELTKLGELAAAKAAATAPATDGDRTQAAVPKSLDRFHHGVSLAMANGLETGYHAPGIDLQLTRLQALGLDHVSLMPFAYQSRPDDPQLRFLNRSPTSETDVGVIYAARRAHARGMGVLWKPHIWLSFNSWPGAIEMTNEADWQRWWRNYRQYIVHHAVLAEWTSSELFSIGVELGRTVHRVDDWRHLIRSVRRIYSGALTYSGNWAGDFEKVEFWPELDFVGVDAYFPLAKTADATPQQLAEGAHRVVASLAAAAQRFGRPMLLTEFGFAARDGAWVAPHEEGGTLSEAHQKLAYEAFLKALGRPDWLQGLYSWKVFSHPSAERRGRPDFRWLGRPAEAVIERYHATTPADSATAAASGSRK